MGRGARGLLLALVALALAYVTSRPASPKAVVPAHSTATKADTSVSVGGATSGRVRVRGGLGDLDVGPATDEGRLVSGRVEPGPDAGFYREVFRRGGELNVEFGLRGTRSLLETAEWDLVLARDVPLLLDVDNRVGDVTLRLADVRLKALKASGGMGNVTVELPPGEYSADLKAKVGDLDVSVPAGTGVRLLVNHGLGDISVPAGYTQRGNTYTSPGYDQVDDRIDLRVSSSMGDVNLKERHD